VAVDSTSGTIAFYKNNTSQGSISYATSSGDYFAVIADGSSSTSTTYAVNFGQQPFAYTPPTGYKALNTYNLPDSTIVAGNKYMDATLWTGNGTSQSITNAASFKPDLVWAKNRGTTNYNVLTDSVRGVQNQIYSNTTDVEATGSNGLTAFNSNGFSVGTNANWNNNTYAFVGWQWQAGQGTTSTNTAGSITSTVSVNATAGFSIVTYTGNGTSGATVGHGLGVAPKMIIIKKRNASGTSWNVYHASTGNTGALFLEATDAFTASITRFNNTSPTSSVFTLGNASALNNSGDTFVAYGWSEIAGFSKFGSYTGNGSTDGTFCFTGFRPKYVMVKRTDSTGEWIIKDTARDTYNQANKNLYANLSNAEDTYSTVELDILSNGFKLRGTATAQNASGGTYIFMAFAENPQKLALAR